MCIRDSLDTVPYGNTEEWNTDPSIPVEKNGRIYARGASDMKSGLAAMVYLLGEIGESGEKPEQTILFLGTCDEEKSGLGAEKILEEIDLSSGSLLLIGEPTEMCIRDSRRTAPESCICFNYCNESRDTCN